MADTSWLDNAQWTDLTPAAGKDWMASAAWAAAPPPPDPRAAVTGNPVTKAITSNPVTQFLTGAAKAPAQAIADVAPAAAPTPDQYQMPAIDEVPRLDAQGNAAPIPTRGDVAALQHDTAAMNYAAQENAPPSTPDRAPFFVVGTPAGMLEKGNIDLAHRPVVDNADGSISTVRSITITDDHGRATLIPTVVGDRVVSNKEAIAHYKKTGESLGTFESEKDADAYAEALHEQQAQMYLPQANTAPAWLKNASFADDYRDQPAQTFDAKFGQGTAEHYLGADLNASAPATGPAMFSRDWWSQQLGATGDQPYGSGAGYLIDNPVTRGLAGFAFDTDSALAQLGARGAGAIGLTDAQQFFENQSAHDAAQSNQLAAPKDSIGGAITQAGTKLGANLLLAASTGGAGAEAQGARAAGTGLMDAAKVAATSPGARMAATLGTTQASTEAAQLEAQGQHVSNTQLASMAALDTAANMVPLAGRTGIAKRVASGALVGEGVNEALNVANGRPLGSGAVMATATGAALGVLPGSHPMSLSDQGRVVGAQVRFDDRMNLLRDSVARQDFEERMNQAAQQGGGFIHPDTVTQLAQSVADEHGTSIAELLRAPKTPMDAGAVAADAALDEARHTVAATTPNIPANPIDVTPLAASEAPVAPDLAPRVPALPEMPQGVSRDDLVQQWRDARTDGEKQSAAARIAAFDQNAPQAPVSAPANAPDIPDFPDLNPSQREVETRARDQVLADPEAAVGAYQALPGTDGGRIISTDEAREIFPDYNTGPEARSANAVAVHEPASFVAKAAWKQALAKPRTGEQAYVLFTGGGTGAGKTTGMRRVPGMENAVQNADIVYDGNLQNAPSAIKKIDQALASKRKVRVIYTFRDPVQAFVHGALPRAERANYGRTVPIPAHVGTHVGAAETYLALKQHYADNPNVIIKAIRNDYDPRTGVSDAGVLADDAHPGALAARNPDILASEVRNALESERQAGRVSDRVYHGTLGTTHDRGEPQGGAGLVGQPEAGPETALADRSGNDRSGTGPGDGQAAESRVTETPPEGGVSAFGESQTRGAAIAELPLADLNLSNDVPQFKSGANDEGVVEPLGGTFDRRGTGPIQVWRRNDGRLEVISGRHRLDLARRSGEQTIPAQVYDEANGFDARQAAALDAELNIRDGQGKVADYVQYFQSPAFDGAEGRQAAESRGLLARATGRRAYAIASQGDAELIAAHRAGQLGDEAAVQIAQAAPNDPALQALGVRQVQTGRSITAAVNTMRALGSMRGDRATQGDIFGFDDSAIRDAEAMGRIAASHQADINKRLSAISGAAKRPELARAEGIDVRDPAAIQNRIGELRSERDAWESWATDPDKVAQVREEAGLKPLPERESPSAEPEQPIDDRTGTMFSKDARDPGTAEMFGAATARERIRAAQEAKDAQRNGKANGHEDTGDGGLFDGARPEQPDLAGQRHSREPEPAATPHTTDDVRATAVKAWGHRFITKLERAGVLHFIDSDKAVELGLGTREELRGVKGIYADGKAYVLSDHVKHLDAVPGIVVHEAGLHFGYDRLTTAEDRQGLRNRVNRALVLGDPDVVRAWKHAEKVGTPARALHEEAMAYLVENSPGNGIVTRLLDAVKRGLNRAGVPMDLLESDSEAIRHTARDMLRRAAKGEKPTRMKVDAEGAQDWRASEIGGVPVFSRDARQTESPEFRRWFGDGKVVDAEGKPLVVYHGSNRSFDTFAPEHAGTGRGSPEEQAYFFTRLPEEASDNAEISAADKGAAQVYPAFLKIENPYVSPLRAYNSEAFAREIAQAKAAGHDGIVFPNVDYKGERGTIAVFDPSQIKSAIGNRGTFDANDADIRHSRDLLGHDDSHVAQARREAAAARATVLNRLAAEGYPQGAVGWTGNPNSYEGFRGGAQRAVAGLVDRYDPIKRMQVAITGGDANAVGDMANVYRLENLMHGRTGDRLARLDRDDVRPLVKSMRQLHVSADLLNDYLLARHAPERNARIASINKELPDGGAGITTEQAKAFMAGDVEGVYSGKKLTPALREKLEMLAKRVDRMRMETLDTLEHSGQITPELAAQLRKAYEYYVPLRGKVSDIDGAAQPSSGGFGGRGVDIKGKPVRRALGRGEGNLAPPHILGEIIGDAQRAIVQAEKARVGRAMLRLALEHPNPEVWQVEPVELEWKFSESTGEAYLGTRKPANDQDVLTVVHNGTPYHVRLVDPRLQEAVMNMDTRSAEFMVHWIGKMNRWLSAAFTRYNPAFMPINMTRDVLLGTVGMTAEHGVGQASAALKYYLPAMRAAWRDFGGKQVGDANVPDAQKSMDDWAREYADAGGKTGIAMADNPDVIAKNLASSVKTGLEILGETTLHPASWGKPLEATGRALSYLKPVVDMVERANDATENAMRLAAYVSKRKAGASPEAAAEVAKNLTVNFNRKGRWGPVLNSLFLFYNASLQGSRRIYQLVKDHPTGMVAFLGSLAALQAQQSMVLMSRKGDDGISDWDAIPDYKKSTALIIALPGKGNYFALPMPYEFGFVTYAGGRMTQHFIEHDPSQKHDSVAADLAVGFLHSFSPVPLEQGLTGLVPAPLQAFMDVRANKDDLGREITFGEDPNGYDKPQSSLGRPGVPAPYVWLSRELNKLGGGDPDWRPPPLAPSITDVSPDSLQYLANFFAGGLGSFVSGSWRTTESALAGVYQDKKDGQTAVDWTKLASEMPILSRFGIKTNVNRARSDRFYDIRDEMDRTKAMIQDKIDHGDFAGAQQVAKDAGIFGDGWTIGMNRNGTPSTRVHSVDGQPKRTLTVEAAPGTMAGAYQEAEYGINVRRGGQSYLIQPGVRDYNRMIHADMGLPGTKRESSVKQLQDQRGGLMGAFLNFYEHRQTQLDPNANR